VRIFDVHSHWGTRRGYPLRGAEALALQKRTWNSEATYDTEEGMAEYFRANGVRTILDFGFTKSLPLAETRSYHDYAIDVQKTYADVIHGLWLQIDPRTGRDGAAELERCIKASSGFVSFCISGPGMGYPASDPVYAPFIEVASAAKRPVLVLVGYTGAGAGMAGGDGVELDLAHPRYVDKLALCYPGLTIVAGRPAWPWQDDMIAVLLHKANVVNELHGWSPKYFSDALKREISRRLTNKIMFGADYPLFRYDRLVADWRALGYDDDVLARAFHKNAEAVFA
jgi:predicted TIM-barrel fold metal-dependent hydrolase